MLAMGRILYRCSSVQGAKELLLGNMYKVSLIDKEMNRKKLALHYSPGVGRICKQIVSTPSSINTFTLRKRAAVIVGDGSMLNVDGKSFLPAMDWFVAQLKFYSDLDPFPVVLAPNADINACIEDLAITYGTILYLDSKPLTTLPPDTLIVRQQLVAKESKCEVTDLELTSKLIAHFNAIGVCKDIQANDFRNLKKFEWTSTQTPTEYKQQLLDGEENINRQAIQMHRHYRGKINVELNFKDISKVKPFFTEKILRKLVQEKNVYSKSSRLCGIISDGTAVLGFGNIGPQAALPVMEGKSLLFQGLAGVEVTPFCIRPRSSVDATTKAIIDLAHHYYALNLEDIASPQCFDIENNLQKMKILPIFHDDQHGTAVVTLAALLNAMKLVGKSADKCKIVINGAGAAGVTVARLLLYKGFKNIILCDTVNAIYKGRSKNMNAIKHQMAEITNLGRETGSLQECLKGADVFIGVSIKGALKGEWIKTMAEKSIIFALANPDPEIMDKEAKENGAYIYGSGRTDLENQINNSLVFPGVFKALLDHNIREITYEMKVKAAEAIANSLKGKLTPSYIVPESLDASIPGKISDAIGKIK